MRGIAIIQDGHTTYAPYNQNVIALYEERNNLIRGTRNEQKEYVTIRNATPDEVRDYLFAEVVASTSGVQNIDSPSSDINNIRALLLESLAQSQVQQAQIEELRKQLNLTAPTAAVLPPKDNPKTSKKVAESIANQPVTSSTPDSLDNLIQDGVFQEIV